MLQSEQEILQKIAWNGKENLQNAWNNPNVPSKFIYLQGIKKEKNKVLPSPWIAQGDGTWCENVPQTIQNQANKFSQTITLKAENVPDGQYYKGEHFIANPHWETKICESQIC